jgi:hypothetical protein
VSDGGAKTCEIQLATRLMGKGQEEAGEWTGRGGDWFQVRGRKDGACGGMQLTTVLVRFVSDGWRKHRHSPIAHGRNGLLPVPLSIISTRKSTTCIGHWQRMNLQRRFPFRVSESEAWEPIEFKPRHLSTPNTYHHLLNGSVAASLQFARCPHMITSHLSGQPSMGFQ